MQGNTNAVIGKGGGSGATVTAINKTGSTITAGSKVWLNENAQTQGSSYQIDNIASSVITSSSGVLSRSGTFAWRNNYLFSIGANSATNIGSFTGNASRVKYGINDSVFIMAQYDSYRVDETIQFAVNYRYIKDNYFASSVNEVVQLNVADGSLVSSLGKIGSMYSSLFVINDKFYSVSSSAYKYTHNGTSFEQTQINITNGATFYPIDVTTDNRYVIGATSDNYSNNTKPPMLRIIEVIDEDNLKMLTQSEMPEDLQEFYSNSGNFVFNPYTGILTAVDYNGHSYVVMKYENGTWTKLAIDLGIGEEPLKGSLTLSDDLTRACIAYGSSGSWYSYIINLTTTQGYAAVPYKFYNVTENTITGYAGNDTEADREIEVSVAGQPSV